MTDEDPPNPPKKKRKTHSGSYTKGNVPFNKGHSKYYRHDDARKLIRAEHLGSVVKFRRWWKWNRPAKIPFRPDIIYKNNGWVSYNDFLGNNNKFENRWGKGHMKQWLPFKEARQWARDQKFTCRSHWMDMLHEVPRRRPDNIPARPDVTYREDWYTWNDWLGLSEDMDTVIKNTIALVPILYVIKLPNSPSNILKVNVTHGGKKSLEDAVKQGAKIIAVFEYTRPIEWQLILSQYASRYRNGDEDDYIFSNINGFLFDVSSILDPFKL